MDENVSEVVLPGKLGTLGARLFVGSLAAAEDAEFHAFVGITHILTAAGRLSVDVPSQPSRPQPIHLVLDLADHPTANLLAALPESMAFCDSAINHRGVLLVHCASGVSRSVSIVIAFLMTRGNLSYDEALTLVRESRPWGNPNLGFQRQLQILGDSGGNLEVAVGQWSSKAGSQVMEEARVQREAANRLHEKIDVVENGIAKDRSDALAKRCVRPSEKASFLQQLDRLRDEIDGSMGESGDRVARTVVKAAAEKVTRLIGELERF